MNARGAGWTVVLLCLSALAPPCVMPQEHPAPVRIGTTISLEGNYSEPAAMIIDAYRLWAMQVNRRGGLLGRPVRLVVYDDRSDPERIAALYTKLITEDKVDLVLSPYGTPLTLKASEVSERHHMVMLAAAASGRAIWQLGRQYVFGVYALADRYFIGQLDLMARKGLNTVSILYENSPFNIDVAYGAAEWAERFGIAVSLRASYQNGAEELPGLLARAIAANARGMIVAAYPPDIYRLIGLMQKTTWRPAAMGMTIAPIHPDFFKNAGPIAEGVFGPSQWEPDERIPFPGTRKFIADFEAFSGRMPSYHAGSAYAACSILEDAVKKAGRIDHDRIRELVISLDTVTVIGRFKVDGTGKQIGHNPILIQWQQGRKEIVYPTKMQTAPAVFPATDSP